MKFKFTGQYKSLTDFQTPNLPNLCVITGLNGSGKTQLLEIIQSLHNKKIQNINNKDWSYTIELISSESSAGNIRYIPYNQLNPNHSGSINSKKYKKIKDDIYDQIENYRNSGLLHSQLLKKIANKLGNNPEKLTKEDIENYVFSHDDFSANDIFKINLGLIFYNYLYNKDQNSYREYRNKNYGNKYTVLTKEEFDTKYPNPWELINTFLGKIKSDYILEDIKEEDFNETLEINPKLINQISRDIIDIGNLSTGERTIISLAFCLYNIELNLDDIFPNILLLDEPDAPLHPTMTKEFLDVIYEELVVKKKIQVILTTHSPSTVALVDEKYIYSMHKDGYRFRKCTKNKALSLLTAGINTFSIEYENRRQIFVESNYDLAFYEKAYEKLKQKNLLEKYISLYFISSGIDKKSNTENISDGDSSRVKKIIKELCVEGGNKNIFGIIDWDGTKTNNQNNNTLRVNGFTKRYSLENYIFDPIILAAFLLDHQIIERSFLDLENNENYADFKNFSCEKLTQIAKKIVGEVQDKLETSPSNLDSCGVEYINGITIDIPQWYLYHHGHSLEELIVLKTFPKLMKEFSSQARLTDESASMLSLSKEEKKDRKNERKKKFKNRLINIIKKRIVKKTYDNIPDFIPKEVLDLFIGIQKKDFNE